MLSFFFGVAEAEPPHPASSKPPSRTEEEDDPLEREGTAALRKSMEQLVADVAIRDAQLRALKEDCARHAKEASRLRTELNEQYSKAADKMMDVAMSATTQAMVDEEAERRRHRFDLELLTAEFAAVERAWARAQHHSSRVAATSSESTWFPR